MPICKNVKHEKFAQALAVKLLSPIDAMIDAGYKNSNRANASRHASNLSLLPDVKARIEELLTADLTDAKRTSITSLHEEAIKKARELLNSDNPTVAAKIIAEVLGRTEPIVRQSQNLTVTISGKDKERRLGVLEAKRAKMNAVTVTEVKEIAK